MQRDTRSGDGLKRARGNSHLAKLMNIRLYNQGKTKCYELHKNHHTHRHVVTCRESKPWRPSFSLLTSMNCSSWPGHLDAAPSRAHGAHPGSFPNETQTPSATQFRSGASPGNGGATEWCLKDPRNPITPRGLIPNCVNTQATPRPPGFTTLLTDLIQTSGLKEMDAGNARQAGSGKLPNARLGEHVGGEELDPRATGQQSHEPRGADKCDVSSKGHGKLSEFPSYQLLCVFLHWAFPPSQCPSQTGL